MANDQKSTGVMDNVRDVVAKNPAAERLMDEVQDFVKMRAEDLVDSLGDRISGVTDRLEDFAAKGGAGQKAAKAVSEGDSPLKAGVKALGTGVKDKVSDMVGGGSGGGKSTKATIIAESIEIGVPVSVAYNQWTQFQEWSRFTKGVQRVDQKDDTTTNWQAKIFLSTRSWESNITEQVPDERIAWESEGDKGTVNGVVTFHELAPNLTKVLLELEYHPKGLFERTGNLWRAQGRRARLDLKNFRRFVMMRGEETGSWRGEIEDSEVTRSPEEVEKEERRKKGRGSDSGESQDGGRRRGSDEGRSRRRRESGEQQGREEGRRRPRKREGGRSERSSEGRERDDSRGERRRRRSSETGSGGSNRSSGRPRESARKRTGAGREQSSGRSSGGSGPVDQG